MCEHRAALHQPPVNSWHVESSSADVIQQFIRVPWFLILVPRKLLFAKLSWKTFQKKQRTKKINQDTISQCVFLLQNTLWFSFAKKCNTVSLSCFTLSLINSDSFVAGHSATKRAQMFTEVWTGAAEPFLSRAAVKGSLVCVYPWPLWCNCGAFACLVKYIYSIAAENNANQSGCLAETSPLANTDLVYLWYSPNLQQQIHF